MKKILLGAIALLAIIITACSSTPAGIALAANGTLLRKIQDHGRLVAGVRFDVPTFGRLNADTRQVDGFEAAIAREIAAYIFGDPNKIDFKEALTATRQDELKKGTFDIILSTVIITEDRLKDIDFSMPYYRSGMRLLVTNNSAIKSTADLNDKKVGTSKGGVFVAWLKANTKATVVEYDTPALSAQDLLKGNIDAIGNNDALLFGLQVGNPGTKVVGVHATTDYFGVGVAKNNPELLNVVNTVIKDLKTSGKWKTIWKTEVGDKIGVAIAPEPPGDDWKK
ncbi:MAG: transporter substrate-binding domain-containing protein [Chloroflexi bacterium]|nr:transporter substrate-binding domain-containing protein [Chloroflexota bacterium]